MTPILVPKVRNIQATQEASAPCQADLMGASTVGNRRWCHGVVATVLVTAEAQVDGQRADQLCAQVLQEAGAGRPVPPFGVDDAELVKQ